MKVTLALCLAAVAIYTVAGTPCTDVCNGNCGLGKMACDYTNFFGDLCNLGAGLCGQVCDAVCGCLDGCNEKCFGARQACLGDGSDLTKVPGCTIQFGLCEGQCNTQCAVQNYSGVIQQLVAQASA